MSAEWVYPAVFALFVAIVGGMVKLLIDSLKEIIRDLKNEVMELRKELANTLSRDEAEVIFERLRGVELKCARQHGNGD